MTSPNETPQTAEVAKARDKYENTIVRHGFGSTIVDDAWAELVTAIRTESSARAREQEARDTKRLDWLQVFGQSGHGLYAESNKRSFDWAPKQQADLRAAIDAAMEAQ